VAGDAVFDDLVIDCSTGDLPLASTLEALRKHFRRSLEAIRKVFGGNLEGLWKQFGRSLEALSKVFK
jgi:hypothetical protein